MSMPEYHLKISLSDNEGKRKQLTCVWCCYRVHQEGQHCYRRGYKTSKGCSICGVALCTTPRYRGKSCFELFHTCEELFDPCTTSADSERTSRPANNSCLPSGQKRALESVFTSASNALAPSRSRNRISISTVGTDGNKNDDESASDEDDNDKEN
jgi:hypothetical protein